MYIYSVHLLGNQPSDSASIPKGAVQVVNSFIQRYKSLISSRSFLLLVFNWTQSSSQGNAAPLCENLYIYLVGEVTFWRRNGGEREGQLANDAFTGFRNLGSSWRAGGAFLCPAGQGQQCLGVDSQLSWCSDVYASKGTGTLVFLDPVLLGAAEWTQIRFLVGNSPPCSLAWWGHLQLSSFWFALPVYASVSLILGLRNRLPWPCGVFKNYILTYTIKLAFSFGLQFCEF